MKTVFNKLFSAHERISYRRLMVFAASCGLLWADKLTGNDWVYIAVAFIAGEAGPRMCAALKSQ